MLTQLVLCLHNEKFSFVLENCQVVGEWGLLLPEHYLVGKKLLNFYFKLSLQLNFMTMTL